MIYRQQPTTKQALLELLWDLWCIVSVIGIWPRFIEPKLLCTSYSKITIAELPRELDGLKIAHISDLHYGPHTTTSFLKRIVDRVQALNCDIIVFTGDLLSYSTLQDPDRLRSFLSSFHAPLGCWAIFGNHDYADYVTLGSDGSFQKALKHSPALMQAFDRLFSASCKENERIKVSDPIEEHPALRSLFEQSGFKVLHNETVHIGKAHSWINLTGLGDIMAEQCHVQMAFQNYDMQAPGIVLSHNPDSFEMLQSYPGNLYLFGHTHGGQVNIPGLWKKITPIQNKLFKSGLFCINHRYLYVNRGLGAPFTFRWFAPPEIACLQLVKQGPVKTTLLDGLFERKQTAPALYQTHKIYDV